MTKNKDTSNNSGSKEKVAQTAQQVAPATAMAVLANLDRYMAAGGYADDHPWRVEIASASGDEDAVEDIINATSILSDLLTLTIQECQSTAAPGNAEAAIRAARRYVEDIFALSNRLLGSAA